MQIVVTMTVLSILLTVSSTALVRMYKQQTLQLERIAHTATWQRLSRDFRNDVHASRSVSRGGDDGTLLILAQTDQTVTWFVVNESLRRVVTVPGAESESTPDPRQSAGETYRFPKSTLQISVNDEFDNVSFAVIELTSSRSPGKTERIEAHVARDESFAIVATSSAN